jgi:hypothetical protein
MCVSPGPPLREFPQQREHKNEIRRLYPDQQAAKAQVQNRGGLKHRHKHSHRQQFSAGSLTKQCC